MLATFLGVTSLWFIALVQRVIPKRKQVLSVRYGESAVVHFLIEKDRAEVRANVHVCRLGDTCSLVVPA